MVALDHRDARPLYLQVKDSLRRMMLTGLLTPGEKLPSVRALATQLAINPNTIQRAYGELEAEGYVYSVSGRGSFVAETDNGQAQRIRELTEKLKPLLEELKAEGVENILALRGDIPSDGHVEKDYSHASDLAAELAAMGDFCIGGACYPEGHPESKNKAEDIRYLKEKVDAGCSFLTTQMFFDNDLFYNFLYRIREAGIAVPVVAGIMPVTNAKQMKRILSMSGTVLPTRFKMLLDRFGDDPAAMKQAGVAYAVSQIIDLVANGIHAIHIYSMNKPDVAAQIQSNISELLK